MQRKKCKLFHFLFLVFKISFKIKGSKKMKRLEGNIKNTKRTPKNSFLFFIDRIKTVFEDFEFFNSFFLLILFTKELTHI